MFDTGAWRLLASGFAARQAAGAVRDLTTVPHCASRLLPQQLRPLSWARAAELPWYENAPRSGRPRPSSGDEHSEPAALVAMNPRSVPSPTLLSGALCAAEGLRFILRTRATWPWAAAPIVAFMGLVAAIFLALESAILGWSDPYLAQLSVTLGAWGRVLLEWLARALVGMMAIWAAVVLAPPLVAPAIEHLVTLQERELKTPSRRPRGFLREFWDGLVAQSIAFCVISPALLALWCLELAIPVTVIVVVPAKLLLLGLGLAWALLDYPMTLRGMGAWSRWTVIRRYPRAVLGFGLVVAAAFWFPCGGLVMLPAAAVGATRLLWTILLVGPDGRPSPECSQWPSCEQS